MKRTDLSWKANSPALGTAAHQELLSKSPEYAKEFKDEQASYRKRLATIESDLAAIDEVPTCLDRLEQAGADRRVVLHLLAIEVAGRRWPKELRRHVRYMRGLAGRLDSITEEVEKVFADPKTYPDLLLVSLQVKRQGPVTPASERVPREDIAAMRKRAESLRTKAAEFGQMLKRGLPSVKRGPVEVLLMERQAIARSIFCICLTRFMRLTNILRSKSVSAKKALKS